MPLQLQPNDEADSLRACRRETDKNLTSTVDVLYSGEILHENGAQPWENGDSLNCVIAPKQRLDCMSLGTLFTGSSAFREETALRRIASESVSGAKVFAGVLISPAAKLKLA